jgi:hypothetical protein
LEVLREGEESIEGEKGRERGEGRERITLIALVLSPDAGSLQG